MSDRSSYSPQRRVGALVQRLLAQRMIDRTVGLQDNLRQAGLTSLDMINLVLSVEGEFGITVPEASINPANFRSIEAISSLIASLLRPP
ncbi:MAG: phosphopantetheine-binding protein [Steroidobacteraceae bacterium]